MQSNILSWMRQHCCCFESPKMQKMQLWSTSKGQTFLARLTSKHKAAAFQGVDIWPAAVSASAKWPKIKYFRGDKTIDQLLAQREITPPRPAVPQLAPPNARWSLNGPPEQACLHLDRFAIRNFGFTIGLRRRVISSNLQPQSCICREQLRAGPSALS